MRIGINIVKSTMFRGKEQEFNNTYYYELETAVTVPAESLVDEVKGKEVPFHGASVNFKRAQVWTTGGTNAQNQMIFQKQLTGAGGQLDIAAQDRERAVLVQWKAGFDSRGIQVYLRKWFHSCGRAAGVDLSAVGIQGNTAAINDASRATIATAADGLRNIGTGDFWSLCSKKGRKTTEPAQAHKYLEHHQLGEMWR